MRPRGIEKILDGALRRLGSVPPETVESVRERIRYNLKSGIAAGKFAPPLDASAPGRWPVRWPILVAGIAALLVVAGTIGGIRKWGAEKTVSVSARQAEQPVQTFVPTPRAATEPAPVRDLGPRPSVPQPLPSPSPQASRFALLPPGDGKLILDRACGGCHRAGAVGNQRLATKAEYANLVSRMVAKGAPLSEAEADTLVDYLFETLATNEKPTTVTAGTAILERACTTCHSLNGIEKYAYESEEPYRQLVDSMITYGAMLSDEETATLVRYLFMTYGKR